MLYLYYHYSDQDTGHFHPHRELPVNQTPVWVLPFLQWGQPGEGGGVRTGPRAHHYSAWLSVQHPVLPRA